MDKRDFIKVFGGSLLLGVSSTYAFRLLTTSFEGWSDEGSPLVGKRYGMVIDLTKCKPDCTACLDACRHENNVSYHNDPRWDNHWIRKVNIESTHGEEKVEKQVILMCNHCDNPPCAQVCPVRATYKREDGIVIVDHHRCIGCRYCMIACPYNARQFNFKDNEEWLNKKHPKRSHGVAEACNLCVHRLDVGEKPACVEVCENIGAKALIVGDLNDPESEISKITSNFAVKRLKEDLGTEPKVFYIGL